MILNDPSKVILSARSFEFDGYQAYSVTERKTNRLMGHVARSKSAATRGQWCYLGVTEPRDTIKQQWTLAGWSRADAVDHLQSWWSPSGAFIGEPI